MRRIELFMLILTLFVSLSNIVLVSLGETRLDVYVALSILIYYVLYAVIDPLLGRSTKYLQALNIGLFILFMIIVAYRVVEILMGV